VSDPFGSFQFVVSVGSQAGTRVIGGFSDVSGLSAEQDVETIRVGGLNTTDVTLPGPTRFPSRLTLKRGLGDETMLWKWYVKILGGEIRREDVTVTLMSSDRRSKVAWTFSDACPVRWTGPELHAASSAVAFESVDLIHRGFLAPDS